MPETAPYLADDGDTLVNPPSPRTALFWDGARWRVPRVDTHGRVQVRGEDQLHSYKEPLSNRRQAVITGAGGWVDSNTPVAGLVWHVTAIAMSDITSATTAIRGEINIAGSVARLYDKVAARDAAVYTFHPCDLWIENTHFIRGTFAGGLMNDTCRVELVGEVFTKE